MTSTEETQDYQTKKKIKDQLNSAWWRLNNLYYITDEKGKKVLFKPNWAQLSFYRTMWYLNIILKARQLGFTTFIQIFILDRCLFTSNVRAGVIAHSKDDAQVFFRDKIKFAYDNLPASIRKEIPAIKNDAGELLLANNSSIRVGTSMRSGTLQYLHISEFGKICRKYPEKAKEIVTGALNAVHAGQFVFIESTAEGNDGAFYRMTQKARALLQTGKKLTTMDYKFFFFPWWKEVRYRIASKSVVIGADEKKYFRELELKHGIKLDERQKAWYSKKMEEQGDDMKREFPSHPDEAFEQAIEGAYYSTQMALLRKAGRLTEVPYEPSLPVNTFWDLGMNDSMTIWFHQRHGIENRLIDYYENSGEGIPHYARVLKKLGYVYGTHYMPHDIAVRDLSVDGGKSRKNVAESLGIKPIMQVRRPKNSEEVLEAIENVRIFLSTAWIDEVSCSKGIKALDNYVKEWDEKGGCFKNRPLHNWASHGSDSLRTGAVGFNDITLALEEDLVPEWFEDI